MNSQPRILVVDDDPDNTVVLRTMLKVCGYSSVDTAHGGEEALAMYAAAHHSEHPYSLVILDLAMPFTNGFDVEEEIRRVGDTATKVVFLSGSADVLPAHHENFERAAGRWVKPLDAETLCRLIDGVLELNHDNGHSNT